MKLMSASKLDPGFRAECARFIVLNPVIKKWSNCVAFATFDPFACILKGAMRRIDVVPQILKTPKVKTPKDLDIMIWWDDLELDDGSYHFALINGEHYEMQTGCGGGFRRVSVKEEHEKVTRMFQHCKRVHSFYLTLKRDYSRSRRNYAAVKRIYDAFYGKKFDRLLTIFQRWDTMIQEDLNKKREAA